jgi:hypothetical protein
MPNRWVEHIRKFAKDNNMTYSCALSDPNIRDGYIPAPKKGKKGKKEVEFEKLEQAFPSTEPKTKNVVIQARPAKKAPAKKAPAKKKEKAPVSTDLLSADDIDTAVMGLLMGMLNNRNKTSADIAEYRKEANRIGDELDKSFAAKKFGKREYNALKGDKMLGFVYSEIGKLRGGAMETHTKSSKVILEGGRTRPPPVFDEEGNEVGRRVRGDRLPVYLADPPPPRFFAPPELVVPALPFPDLPDLPDTPRVFLRRVEDRIGGARRKRPREAGGDDRDEREELEPLPEEDPRTPPQSPQPLIQPDTPIHPSFLPNPNPNLVIMPPPPFFDNEGAGEGLFPLQLPAQQLPAQQLPAQSEGEGETDGDESALDRKSVV